MNKESEKAGLKLNTQKTKIMASSPVTSWQINEETMEMMTDFIFLGSKITVNGDCSHEIKRCLLPERKAMKNLHCFKKQRHYFANKGLYVQNFGFPVVTYGCESWTVKQTECQRLMPSNCGVGEHE